MHHAHASGSLQGPAWRGPWGLLPSRHCQTLPPIRRVGGKQVCQDLGSPGWLEEEECWPWGAQAPAPHPGGRPQLEAVLRGGGPLWPSPQAGAPPKAGASPQAGASPPPAWASLSVSVE